MDRISMETKVYELTNGSICAVVYKDNIPWNIIYGIEQMELYGRAIIRLCIEGFPTAQKYQEENNNGISIVKAAMDIERNGKEVMSCKNGIASLRFEKMGFASRVLFGI